MVIARPQDESCGRHCECEYAKSRPERDAFLTIISSTIAQVGTRVDILILFVSNIALVPACLELINSSKKSQFSPFFTFQPCSGFMSSESDMLIYYLFRLRTFVLTNIFVSPMPIKDIQTYSYLGHGSFD
ncbi:hypothetical protein BLOT_000085 [Blomia tropicalis]|nr:hypothetical protein BLOT_000085 [Blomia tropicalis]